ncbi:hypothetical protein C7M84_001272 [Penaeus vannamei]|uniref:Ran-GTPase activating protein 1 C-terminal domain-containing protein n=1 Tax=Penaeus vannamei TaxID=6689 RepID=A0A3R7PR40_PENVA|nr:hypothetical protein C7M84_001272 [Penaeus vannamei]
MDTTLSFAGQNNKWNTAEDVQAAAEAIRNHKDLRCLVLEANTLGVEAAKVMGDALAMHPEFERAHWKDLFTGRLKTEIPEALRHLFSGLIRAGAKLKELDLSDNALGPVGVEGMVDFMSSPVCYSLQELRLNNNGLGIKGGTMLAESLMRLVDNAKAAGTPLTLKVFIAGRNRLEKEGAKVYAKFFKAVGTLEEVAMPQNGIFHEGIAALADAFSTNNNLRVVNLNDNTFTPKGAQAMADKLPMMQNLEVINFGDCLIKTAGAKMIAKALTSGHKNLRELFLDSNEINIKGGLAIAEAMADKENLDKLMLDCNQFGEDGREMLISLLNDLVSPLKRGESVVIPVKCTAEEFCEQPTAARLLGLGNSGPSQLVEEAKRLAEGSEEALINFCLKILMRTGSIATSNNAEVQKAVNAATEQLAKAAFAAAQKSDSLSLATNSLLVHLGLIKCEDKKFKLEWDLKGCLIALATIVSSPLFPEQTKSTLQLFLSKPNPKIDVHNQEKHKLMVALFQ